MNPSIVSHISLGTDDFDTALAFYDRVLETLGAKRIMNHPGAAAWGKQFPEFWLHRPLDQQKASVGNGTHVGFMCGSREQVQAFWKEALAAGAQPEGEPGPRPQYSEAYYGCFVRDIDGHKIEASFWDTSIAPVG